MEIINSIIFYILAVSIVFTSIAVIFAKRIMNAVFFALICFFCFGFLYFSLNAPFNGAVQMSVYGAALSILFAVAVMITNYKDEENRRIKFSPKILISICGVLMIISAVTVFFKETAAYDPAMMMYISSSDIYTHNDNIKQLSVELLSGNLYSFELLGVYLLIVLIGIAFLLAFKGETK